MYRIPRYRVCLVREASHPSEVKSINSPADAFGLLRTYLDLDGADRENFVAVLVDTKNKVIGINTVSVGALNTTVVHPREVFKPAVLCNAAGVLLAHNHPSGDATPSEDDMKTTKRLCDAGTILGITVLDHIIIGEDGYFSFKAQGLI